MCCTAGQATEGNMAHAPQKAIWRTRNAYFIPKATNTHSESVTLTAFPPKQWLRERATLLRYTDAACLVSLA